MMIEGVEVVVEAEARIEVAEAVGVAAVANRTERCIKGIQMSRVKPWLI